MNLQSDNSKFANRCDFLSKKLTALETRNESLEIMLEQVRGENIVYQEKTQTLMEKVDEQVVTRSRIERQTAIVQEDAGRKNKVMEAQRSKIDEL